MTDPIIIGDPPPPQKRISTWVGAAVATVGMAAVNSPELTQAIIDTAKTIAGDNALGASLAVLGAQQTILAARRWFQRRLARTRSA